MSAAAADPPAASGGGTTISLKRQKEDFVSGHDGTTPRELLVVCSASFVGMMFYRAVGDVVILLLVASDGAGAPAEEESSPATATVLWGSRKGAGSMLLLMLAVANEIASFWVPMVLCQSRYLYPYGAAYLSFQVAFSILVSRVVSPLLRGSAVGEKGQQQQRDAAASAAADDARGCRNLAVTAYRSSLMYLTFVAILAVDFRLFPRRFAKTEVAGYSLMDLGAASFVCAAGLVSPRARYFHLPQQVPRATRRRLFKVLKRTAPLLFMGSLRLATHKGIEYQEHVSEYGVHWNFFFTLAFIVPLPLFVPPSDRPTWYVPAGILIGYQVALSLYGVQEWVVDSPRSCDSSSSLASVCDLFAANREGVLGCIGFAALYLLSEWMGKIFLWNRNGEPAATETSVSGSNQRPYRSLWPAAIAWGIIWQLLEKGFAIPASRRTTNATFIFWVLLVNTIILAAMLKVTVFADGSHLRPHWRVPERQQLVPPIMEAINKQGLAVFVVANLLTGAVNLSTNTLEASDSTAFLILFLYLCAIGAFASGFGWALRQLQMRRHGAPVKQQRHTD